MTNKEANKEYIIAEEKEFLGKEVGDEFVEPKENIGGYETIGCELLSASDYKQWVHAAMYASLVTWDTTPHVPVTKFLELSHEEKEEKLFYMLNQRPISVALEGAVFTFKLTGIPRAMTHQIVRHRQMSFGQQSFRVSSCYSDPVRIPPTLMQMEDGPVKNELIARYDRTVSEMRFVYKELVKHGVPTEQARNIMPMGICTKIAVTMRLRDMIEYFKGRTSGIAQDEHTYIVCLMAKEMKEKQPEFFNFIKTKATNIEEVMRTYLQ